jgi:heme-degrading monooxygenase HmoA
MITLHVYMKPITGHSEALQTAIRDTWVSTMAEQPGFIKAVMLTPFGDDYSTDIEAISFWESEELRLEWVARPIHDQVFVTIMEIVETISSTVKAVEHSWNL